MNNKELQAAKQTNAVLRAQLWLRNEEAIGRLSENDKRRADRVGRLTNDEYLFPEATLRTRILFTQLGTRQAAFWTLATQRAKSYMLREIAQQTKGIPFFDYTGGERWNVYALEGDEPTLLGTLDLGGFATLPELRAAWEVTGGAQ